MRRIALATVVAVSVLAGPVAAGAQESGKTMTARLSVSSPHVLAEEGHTVQGALTSQEGLRLITAFHPNVVLLDVSLPDLSGLEVAKRIRRSFSNRSNYGDPEYRSPNAPATPLNLVPSPMSTNHSTTHTSSA
jgi:hypothetical protein